MKHVLLSEVGLMPDGRQARNFYTKKYGFGQIVEAPSTEETVSGVEVHFQDVDKGITGVTYNKDPDVLQDAAALASLVEFTLKLVADSSH